MPEDSTHTPAPTWLDLERILPLKEASKVSGLCQDSLPNFDPIAIGDEVAALEREAQSKLADAKGEFASRSEKIASILWKVKQHHPEHLDAICERAEIGLSRRKELLQIGSGRKIKQSRQATAALQAKFSH
jgi:hypothetical protein